MQTNDKKENEENCVSKIIKCPKYGFSLFIFHKYKISI